ncbi:hypothetical protein L5F46_05955 [Aliarcobacter butzleri]|uniref:hypothetical protein n=1 Tax=Aliarcobacter butzleri TaxID=28197 RepID=UPI001EDF6756|nr:hypothetical protein [Aliarcobacter butzleri]MCG3674319.1 hypothetical protein [Aliarcobacter butzleri]
MNEIGIFDMLILAIKTQPALIAITIAIFVALTKSNSISAYVFLLVSLSLQYYATAKEFQNTLEIKTTISCLEQKIEALNKNINIDNLEISICKSSEILKKINKSF